MKRIESLLITLLLFGFTFITGCEKDNSTGKAELQVIDIDGEWKGYLLMDGQGNELTADSSYALSIVQNTNDLSGTLVLPEEFGVNSPVTLSGSVNPDSTIVMSGSANSIKLSIYGLVEDPHSLQLAIVGLEENGLLVLFSKSDQLLTSPIMKDNTYKLNLVIGVAGQGRSVILVHGMNDNAKTWDTMVEYFKNHGIHTTTKATGTLNIPSASENNVTFNVTTTSIPSTSGIAVADIVVFNPTSPGMVIGADKSLFIKVKSTSVAGVNRFKVNDGEDSYELNTSVPILISNSQSSISITLVYGENALGNVWEYEYKWWDFIYNNAHHLLDSVNVRQDKGDIGTEPIIIAHSMGGLVARSYIVQGGDFYRLVTLGTPHLGSKLAHFVPFSNEDGIGDLLPGHDFLNYLNTADISHRSKYWLINGRAGTYPSCYVGTVATCYKWHTPEPTSVEKAGHAALEKPNDGMVPTSSARFSGNDYYSADENVHNVNTFEWVDHKMLNRDSRISKWVTEFVMNHQK